MINQNRSRQMSNEGAINGMKMKMEWIGLNYRRRMRLECRESRNEIPWSGFVGGDLKMLEKMTEDCTDC